MQVSTLVVWIMTGCLAAVAGAPAAGAAETLIFDGTQAISGLPIRPDPEDAANPVGSWPGATKGHRMPVSRSVVDCTGAGALRFRFYSAAADGHRIVVLCGSNPEAEGEGEAPSGNYYSSGFTIDWVGWKDVVLPFSGFQSHRAPVGWQRITDIHFANNGYDGASPNPEADYRVDDLAAIPYEEVGVIVEPDGSFTLTAATRHHTVSLPIEAQEESIQGIAYEVRGERGATPTVRQLSTYTATGAERQRYDFMGRNWTSISSDGWEQRRLEFVALAGGVAADLRFNLHGDAAVEIRKVELVRGGWPQDPPHPAAPYLDWIETLEPDLALASRSPLTLFVEDGGHDMWMRAYRELGLDDEQQAEFERDLAVYRELTVAELIALMPQRRPFRFNGGQWGEPHTWSPTDPDAIYDAKTGERFDVAATYPIHGHEAVVAPSGKTVRYAYHDSDPDGPKGGQRIYVEHFMTDARMAALFRAGFEMAMLYRKTGDEAWGIRSAAILWSLCRQMPDWPVTGKPAWNSPPPDKRRLRDPDYYSWFSFVMGGDWYCTEGGLLYPPRYFDLIRDTPAWDALAAQIEVEDPRMETAQGMLHVVRMFLKRDATYRNSQFVFFHNLSGTANRSVIQVARALGIPDLLHYGTNKVVATFDYCFMADGVFPESQWYTLDQFNRQKEALDPLRGYVDPPGFEPTFGARFEQPIADPMAAVPGLERVRTALQRLAYPDGSRSTVHDSWSATANPPDSPYDTTFPVRDHIDPFLFTSYGHGIIGRGTPATGTEAHLHFSGAYNHAHRDMLNLILWAKGDELVSDIGYSHLGSYAGNSLSHNLVVVDSMVQRVGIHAGDLRLWADRAGSTQIVQARQGSNQAYPQCSRYQRTLVMLPFGPEREVVLDLFEVEGGQRHEWLAQGSADYDQRVEWSLLEGEGDGEVRDNLAADGVAVEDPYPWSSEPGKEHSHDKHGRPSVFYGAFRDARILPNRAPWTATMSAGKQATAEDAWAGDRALSTGPKPGLRVHWLGPQDGEAILAWAPRNRYRDELQHKPAARAAWSELRLPKLIVRRDANGDEPLRSRFAALWEPHASGTFVDRAAALDGVTGGGAAWEVVVGDRSATVLYRDERAEPAVAIGALRSDASVAIRSEGPDGVRLEMSDGTTIEDQAITLRVTAVAPLAVTGVVDEDGEHLLTTEAGPAPIATGAQRPAWVVVRQGEASGRWLQVDGVQVAGAGLAFCLVGDPGFTFDGDEGVLHETGFPHRFAFGAAELHQPSWGEVLRRTEADGSILLRARSSAPGQLILKGVPAAEVTRREGDAWRAVATEVGDQGLELALPCPATAEGWVELRVVPR